MPSSKSPHVAIVGAGPIGLEIAVALKRAGIEFSIFDAGSVGQTISWWAPQTRWFSSNERISIAGIPLLTPDQTKASREQYLTYLRGVAQQFKIPVQTQTEVTSVESNETGFSLTLRSTRAAETATATAVVLAIGGTDTPRQLGVPGEQLPHVDGYLRETHRYFGRRVLIVGGRNSAIEAALRLHHAGAQVSLSYRGDRLPEDGIKYWLLPEIKGLLKTGRIQDCMATEPVEIFSDRVKLRSTATGDIQEVAADDVLSLIGYEQDKSLLRASGVKLVGEMERPSYDPETMETNVPGLFVAGTATAGTQTSKYKTFLENCHDHAGKIIARLTGHSSESSAQAYQQQIEFQPES